MEEVRKNLPQPSAHVRHSPEHSIIPLGRRPQVRDFLLVFAGLVFEFVESEVFDFLVRDALDWHLSRAVVIRYVWKRRDTGATVRT
jgi:hypothetical protein